MSVKILLSVFTLCISTAAFSQKNPAVRPTLRHVVLFSFKTASSVSDIKKIEDAFAALPSRISEIKGFEWGLNNSPENLNQGFTHCFLVSFDSEKQRDIYLPHPAHKEFVQLLGPHLDKVLVFDYWAGK
jgi:hypothetical protein